MLRYVVTRFITMLLVLFVVSAALFSLSHAAPGGPLASLVPPDMVGDSGPLIEAKTKEFGLDQPLPVQYLRWVSHIAVGDLGTSFQFNRSVASRTARMNNFASAYCQSLCVRFQAWRILLGSVLERCAA